eukprot:CAMPEP_0196570442 /NCGR_PEP_ID=MMETSP1081-20130531/527_1 /TAXON_ID=36882 /ORGANISM="Pyramimonas amylifera, Strain CCMP720" /LENGTH=281 /DNA_ID=CAMNT_0041886889 /DNA_START=567 /DNA_END=1412 /DNA_ORIENTATION=+
MVKDSLLIHFSHKVDESIWMLAETESKFFKVTTALRSGNHYFKIHPTEDPTTLTQLDQVLQAFTPFQSAVHQIISQNATNTSDLDALVQTSPSLLQEISALKVLYSDSMQLPAQLEMETAARLRTNSLKMMTEYLFVVAKYEVDTYNATLALAVSDFDTTLSDLSNGNDEKGLSAPNDPQLFQWLNLVEQTWRGEQGLKRVMQIYPTVFRMDYLSEEITPFVGKLNMVVATYGMTGTIPPSPPMGLPPPTPSKKNDSHVLGVGVTLVFGLSLLTLPLFKEQ